MERPLTTTNNSNHYIKSPIIDSGNYELKNPKKIIKFTYNKEQPRLKPDYNKKRIMNKNIIERDMTEPELLKNENPIKNYVQKQNNQRTLNLSYHNQEQITPHHQIKQKKMVRYNTNNNPTINQTYSSNTNQNPQIFNNYVSINNLVAQNFPVKVINVFGNK